MLKSEGRVRRETRTQREQLVASFQEAAVSDWPYPLTPVMLRVIAGFCIRQHGIVMQDCFAARALETPHSRVRVVQLDTAMGYTHRSTARSAPWCEGSGRQSREILCVWHTNTEVFHRFK